MCDDCFNETYFPDDYAAYKKRLLKLENGKEIDPICMEQKDFEKALNLNHYIETKEGKEDKVYVDAFFLFLEKLGLNKITAFRLYDGETTEILNWDFNKIKENLYLAYQRKGLFYDDDVCVSQAFTDLKSFFAIVQEGIIFFSGNEGSTDKMKEVLNNLNIGFIQDF
jgi:hypothetical protein